MKHGRLFFSVGILSFLTLASEAPAQAGLFQKCAELLTKRPLPTNSAPNESTNGAIAYVSTLVENRVLGDNELERLARALDDGRIINPIDPEDANLSSSLFIHYEGLETKLRQPGIELDRLKQWLAATLKARTSNRDERSSAQTETHALIGTQFVQVPGRKFRMGGWWNGVSTELTHPIEVMSTPMTQDDWFTLFDSSASDFTHGDDAVTRINRDGVEISIRPDHPVDRITWWSAVVAANRLSERRGLPPVYDLSEVDFMDLSDTRHWPPRSTRDPALILSYAARGTLRAQDHAPFPKINAPDGDIYQARGYRLPTAAEQINLLLLETKQNGHLGFKKRAWYRENTRDPNKHPDARLETRPVALLKPLVLEGGSLFDLLGNVNEWSHDAVAYRSTAVQGGVNPSAGQNVYWRQERGGHSGSYQRELDSCFRHDSPACVAFNSSVRLVRTLR